MIDASFPLKTSILASGDTALGRGVHGAIPLHLVFEAKDVKAPLKYKIALAEAKPLEKNAYKVPLAQTLVRRALAKAGQS